ncbi:MAG: ATP-binding protein [Victivallales bacterium]|nr:ATP-binding protein [Victivallales bacterium]
MNRKTFTATIKTDFTALEDIGTAVREFLTAAQVGGEAAYKIELALEEMVTNVIKYGYDVPDDANSVTVTVSLLPDRIVLAIADTGHEFNPLLAAPPDTAGGLDERPIGGVGIHLTRKMTDAMTYSRHNGRNLLSITVKLTP